MTNHQSLIQHSVQGFLSLGKYLGFFLLVYVAINWWRQPVMPVNAELNLTDYRGSAIDLQALSTQKPTLLYFWGSWCGICSVTSPNINALDQSGYSVVTIAVKSGDNAELHDYLQQQQFHYPVINDEHGQIFADWQGKVTPSYIILKDGEAKQGLSGIQPLWSLKLRLWLSS